MHAGILVVFLLATPSIAARFELTTGDDCTASAAARAGSTPRVQPVDPIAAARLGELVRDSTIVREMLAYLESATVALTVRSSASLLRDHRSGGLSRFFVDKGVLKGRLEFDRMMRDQSQQRITLAHELGHAVELAALPRNSTASLGNQLLAQIGQHDPWSSQLVIETPFAHAIDAGVNAELKYGAASPGMLHTVAKRHRIAIGGCDAGRSSAAAHDAARTKQQ